LFFVFDISNILISNNFQSNFRPINLFMIMRTLSLPFLQYHTDLQILR